MPGPEAPQEVSNQPTLGRIMLASDEPPLGRLVLDSTEALPVEPYVLTDLDEIADLARAIEGSIAAQAAEHGFEVDLSIGAFPSPTYEDEDAFRFADDNPF